jgi:alkanesulfonate monooxygenase SsuD/methylene tetrahydromethanopterin reductase-like flavin-dependent oxidoreductase (luciferase family)
MKFALSVAMNDPVELCELAKVAEEAGWDSISLADHIIYPEKLTTPYP